MARKKTEHQQTTVSSDSEISDEEEQEEEPPRIIIPSKKTKKGNVENDENDERMKRVKQQANQIIRSQPNDVLISLFEYLKQQLIGRPQFEFAAIYGKEQKLAQLLHTFQTRERSHARFKITTRKNFEVAVDGKNYGGFDSLDLKGLISKGTVAPFGKGSETVVDLQVRNCLHIKSDRIKFKHQNLETLLVKKLNEDNKLSQLFSTSVDVVFDKMCIYQKGGFFKTHVDTLKNNRHVASLVLSVMSNYEGGDLCIVDGDKRACEHLSAGDAVVFYTDMSHEVTPVTAGTRVTLHFDIFDDNVTNSNRAVTAEDNSNMVGTSIGQRINHAIEEKLSQITAKQPKPKSKSKSTKKTTQQQSTDDKMIGFLLKHKYHANTAVQNLKGADLRLYQHFFAAGHRCTFETVCVRYYAGYDSNADSSFSVYPINPFDNAMAMLSRDKVIGVVIPCDEDFESSRDLQQFHYIPGIEYTGNESQSAENFYYSAILLVSCRAEKLENRMNLKRVGNGFSDLTIIADGIATATTTTSASSSSSKKKSVMEISSDEEEEEEKPKKKKGKQVAKKKKKSASSDDEDDEDYEEEEDEKPKKKQKVTK